MAFRQSPQQATVWAFIGGWLFTLLLIWVAFAVAHSAIVGSMGLDLQQRLDTDTYVLEDHASRSLDGVASSLEALATLTSREEVADGRRLSEKLKELQFDNVIVRGLSLVDARDTVLASSNLGNVGQRVSAAVLQGLGPAPREARHGVRYSGSIAQRDLPDPGTEGAAAQPFWLASIDVKSPELRGYRWVAAINAGFFLNFWSAATQGGGTMMGLFDYTGQPLVALGRGPEATSALSAGLAEALLSRDQGDLAVPALDNWLIRYRASSRHPVAFVMMADRDLQAQRTFQRTAALRWSALIGSMLASAAFLLGYRALSRYRRAVFLGHKHQLAAHTDPLTGVGNRRAFEEAAPLMLEQAAAMGLPLALMVLDLDHFKQVNDQHGHLAGDAVLQEMALRWRGVLRSDDLLVRAGGEEFYVMLSAAGWQQAQAVAQKLIEAARRGPVRLPGDHAGVTVTVSIGLAAVEVCPPKADLRSLLMAADEALYRAKAEGRDRCVTTEWLRVDQADPRFKGLLAGAIKLDNG